MNYSNVKIYHKILLSMFCCCMLPVVMMQYCIPHMRFTLLIATSEDLLFYKHRYHIHYYSASVLFFIVFYIYPLTNWTMLYVPTWFFVYQLCSIVDILVFVLEWDRVQPGTYQGSRESKVWLNHSIPFFAMYIDGMFIEFENRDNADKPTESTIFQMSFSQLRMFHW